MAIESGYTDFFYLLNELLLSCPKNSLRRELRGERENDLSYDTTNVLLAELAGQAASHKRSESLIFRLTSWLRDNKARPYSPTAKIYFDLRNEVQRLALSASNRDSRSSDIGEANLKLLDTGCEETRKIRLLTGGEEFHQFLKISAIALRHKNLRDITEFRNGFSELFEIANPLRPQIIAVFRRLRNAALDAALFLSAEHELTRRDALLKAGGVLEEARELSNDVYEPERSLLLAVIEHWRRMFAVVGGLVAEKQEVETLPNPYVAGRAIRPDDGRLFAGRREEMKLIEEKLQTGVGLVIWGQRRIGKTSILLHLRERLPHDLLPVYLNLQMLMANSTGGFLRAVGNQIVKELRDKLHVLSSPFRRQKSNGETQPPEGGTTNTLAEALLPAEDFDREPYLSFNHLLEEVEQRLLPGQRVLLSFDEFEELEQRVKTGKIEKEIFAYLRGVTQTGRGFALMFAGLHTLEEMTREYWNPFFQSVQTVRIGYLSELDAEQLIRDPMEQFPLDYELEAVNRITEVTRSHPYLTQSLCHNLVNRLNDPLHRSQKATREDVDAVLERTLESSGYYFDDYVWGWSGADEQLALALLAEAGDDAAFSVVEKHLGREAALEATRKLVAREILTERTAAGELVFRFQIPLARLWVRRTKSSARILLERQKP